MERKILIASVLATFGFSTFLLGYFFVNPKNTAIQSGSLIDRFDTIENKKVVDDTSRTLAVSNRKLLDFVVSPSNSQKIVAVDKSGVIIEINTQDLRETVIVNLKSKELTSALLSPNGSSIYYSFYNDGKKHLYLNFRKGVPIEIGGGVKSATFSSHDDGLLYLSGNESEEVLSVLKNNATKKILNTRLNNAALSWPSKFMSLISYDKDGYGDLLILDDENRLNKIISYQKDLAVQWSPSAQRLLFSTKDNSNAHRLYYQEFGKDESVDLEVSTDASRCAWLAGETSVICGITDQPTFKNEFYQVNVIDKSKVVVVIPSVNLITKKIALDHSENTVFVLNEIDNKLYALKIK